MNFPDLNALLGGGGDHVDEFASSNPLRRLRSDGPIHELVSEHLAQSAFAPFHHTEVTGSLIARNFYVPFFLGLFYNLHAQQGDEITAIYSRETDHKLEMAVLYGESSRNAYLHIHEINLGPLSGMNSAPSVSDESRPKSLIALIESEVDASLVRRLDNVAKYQYNIEAPGGIHDLLKPRMSLTSSTTVSKHSLPDDPAVGSETPVENYYNILNFIQDTPERLDEWRQFKSSLDEVSDADVGPTREQLKTCVELAFINMFPRLAAYSRTLPQPHEEGVTNAGFLHGLLFPSLPTEYYHQIIDSRRPPFIHNTDGIYMYFTTSAEMEHEHIVISPRSERFHGLMGYNILETLTHHRQEASVLEIWSENDFRTVDNEGTVRMRELRWDIHNVMEMLQADISQLRILTSRSRNPLFDRIVFPEENSVDGEGNERREERLQHQMQEIERRIRLNEQQLDAENQMESLEFQQNVFFLQMRALKYKHLIRKMAMGTEVGGGIDSLKYFLLGYIKTNIDPSIKAKLNFGSQADAFLVKRDVFEYMITFEQASDDTDVKDLLNEHSDDNMLRLNCKIEDRGGLELQFKTGPKNELPHQTIQTVHLTRKLERIHEMTKSSPLNTDSKRVATSFHNDMKSVLDEMNLRSIPHLKREAYLKGALWKMGATHITSSVEGQNLKMLAQIPVGDGNEQHISLQLLVSDYDAAFVASITRPWVSEDHVVSTAYNAAPGRGEIAVRAMSNSLRFLNTENVNAVCETRLRRKRNVAKYCEMIDEKYVEEESESVKDFENVKELVQDKFPELAEHISAVHDVVGRLQLVFIARDAFSRLYQGDIKGFFKIAAFFGLNLAVSSGGAKLVTYGLEQKIAGNLARGSMAQLVGGCLPGAVFSIPMTVQLFEEMKNDDTDSAVLTGSFLATEAARCALQAAVAFGVRSLIPVVVGEALGVVGLVILGGIYVHDAVKAVDKIMEVIPLDTNERIYVGTRIFVGIGPSDMIESMMAELSANEAAALLTSYQYPYINRFLISAASKINSDRTLSYFPDNAVDLTTTYHFDKSRLMPGKAALGDNFTTFCALNGKLDPMHDELYKKTHEFNGIFSYFAKDYSDPVIDYRCKNTFGIARKNKTNFPMTLFLLYNGTDNVVGFPNEGNAFLLMNGEKIIHGGSSNDQFLIQGTNISGFLNGSDGQDTVDFSNMGDPDRILYIYDGRAHLSPTYDIKLELELHDIENVLGRVGHRDSIEVCNETQIDLGGSAAVSDFINIASRCNHKANQTIVVTLRSNTVVYGRREDAKVHFMAADEAVAEAQLDAGEHIFWLKTALLNETKFIAQNDYKRFEFSNSNQLRLVHKESANITFIFVKENITVQLDGETFKLILKGMNVLTNVIQKYAAYVEQNPNVLLVANTEQGKVILHHNSFEMEVDGKRKNVNLVQNVLHTNVSLYGHRGLDNYFLISHNVSHQSTLNNTFNITIYPHLSENTTCIIDMMKLSISAFENMHGEYGLLIKPKLVGGDIVIKILMTSNTIQTGRTQIGELIIKDGYNYINEIKIFLHNENRLLDHAGVLELYNTLDSKQSILSIFPGSFEFYGSIKFYYEANFLETYLMNDTLVITNVASGEVVASQNPVTIFLIDYARYKAKYNTLSLVFKNFKISLDGIGASLKDLPNYRSIWPRLKQKLNDKKSEYNVSQIMMKMRDNEFMLKN